MATLCPSPSLTARRQPRRIGRSNRSSGGTEGARARGQAEAGVW